MVEQGTPLAQPTSTINKEHAVGQPVNGRRVGVETKFSCTENRNGSDVV